MSNVAQFRSMTELHQKLPVFYQPWWLDAVCSNWDVVLLHRNGIRGVWPFQLESKGFLSLIRTPLLTPYLQPLLIADEHAVFMANDSASFAEFLSLMPRYDFLQFQTLPGYDISFIKANPSFKTQFRRTYYLHLQASAEDIFSNVHQKRRNDIRKAQRDLSVAATAMPLHSFSTLHAQTFSRKGQKYRYTPDFIERVVEAATQNNAALCLVAKDKEENIQGILWAVYDTTTMYYLLSTTAATNRHRGAISLLIWSAICTAREKGLKLFDFEGSMDPGIAAFFEKFGGEEQEYFSVSHTPSFLWRLKQSLTS